MPILTLCIIQMPNGAIEGEEAKEMGNVYWDNI
jgi:hypothetical protein